MKPTFVTEIENIANKISNSINKIDFRVYAPLAKKYGTGDATIWGLSKDIYFGKIEMPKWVN
jgi:hypothetical protein